LQALCAADSRKLSSRQATEQLSSLPQLTDESSGNEADQTFAEGIVQGVLVGREAHDALIDACSVNWRVSRMSIVDRNILRLAAYEFRFCEDIPGSVTVNEAIELAKRYGSKDSRAFVNGLLDKMGRQIGKLGGPRVDHQ
jgi:N utilization substance protein B